MWRCASFRCDDPRRCLDARWDAGFACNMRGSRDPHWRSLIITDWHRHFWRLRENGPERDFGVFPQEIESETSSGRAGEQKHPQTWVSHLSDERWTLELHTKSTFFPYNGFFVIVIVTLCNNVCYLPVLNSYYSMFKRKCIFLFTVKQFCLVKF